MKLKKGDHVRGIIDGGVGECYTGIVYCLSSDNYFATIKRDDGKQGSGIDIPGYGQGWAVSYCKKSEVWGSSESLGLLEIISTEGEHMDIKKKFALLLASEPRKSFRKAGITDGDDLLTPEGQQIFLSWLLHDKYADDFKKAIVDEILKKDKEDE